MHIDGDVAGGGTNVAFLSMTCQFSAIISSKCPGAQVLNIQHYTTSIYYFVRVHMRDFCTVSLHATGLSPDLQSMEQIRRIMRPTDVPDQGTTYLGMENRDQGMEI